jgi:hypothetical protein
VFNSMFGVAGYSFHHCPIIGISLSRTQACTCYDGFMTRANILVATAWASSAAVSVAAIAAWGQTYSWRLDHISTYQLFPLFGLLAFSLMWAHYALSAARRYFGLERTVLARYFEVTSLAVLVTIVLHPSLLVWQLWRDGFGLPPGSYLRYVGRGLHIAVFLGSVSLFMFLAYELRRWFIERSWWHFMGYVSDLAMAFIFYHALRLGAGLHIGWFRALWFFYGVSLAVVLGFNYYQTWQKSRSAAD